MIACLEPAAWAYALGILGLAIVVALLVALERLITRAFESRR